jgi:hypothetical protein
VKHKVSTPKTLIAGLLLLAAVLIWSWAHMRASSSPIPANVAPAPVDSSRFVLDMVSNNPGEPLPDSKFRDPRFLAGLGYNGQISVSEVEGVPTFNAMGIDLLPVGGKERDWAAKHADELQDQIHAAHQAGLKCYAWMQMIVLPKAVVAKYKDDICDSQGRIDIDLPTTQMLVREQLKEIFEHLPDLDGLVIRTGEIYLQDLPYHAASAAPDGRLIPGSTAILHGPESHIQLLNILRDEVCVKRNKMVFYRTWDFGDNFHNNPDYYLKVTDAIDPHPNLIFSIKHQAGDFHQLTPFNPTLGIGKHRQIVEVQCQREAYGKGAHPYYIGQGVIDGWEEYAWMMTADQPHGLRDICHRPQFAGVCTWSRGGGWEGPYIHNELWCELNAYVIAKFAENPERNEADIFSDFEKSIGLTGDDVQRFRELNLLSTKAVLRGQLTTLDAKIDPWWARDDFLAAPDLSDFIKKGLADQALGEKHQAVQMWEQIEQLARQIKFADPATSDFVTTSAAYGRIKYAIIEQAWTILIKGAQGDAISKYDNEALVSAITKYDQLWKQWRTLSEEYPQCSTLYKEVAFKNKPGMAAAIDRYRRTTGLQEPAPYANLPR